MFLGKEPFSSSKLPHVVVVYLTYAEVPLCFPKACPTSMPLHLLTPTDLPQLALGPTIIRTYNVLSVGFQGKTADKGISSTKPKEGDLVEEGTILFSLSWMTISISHCQFLLQGRESIKELRSACTVTFVSGSDSLNSLPHTPLSGTGMHRIVLLLWQIDDEMINQSEASYWNRYERTVCSKTLCGINCLLFSLPHKKEMQAVPFGGGVFVIITFIKCHVGKITCVHARSA